MGLLADVEAVVHLAALAHQISTAGVGRWEEFKDANVRLTSALTRACAESKVARLIFISSIGVYGASSKLPVTAHTPTKPANDYARSKLEAEQVIERELASTKTDWCILRSPLIYGPGNPGNMDRLMRLIRLRLPLPFGSIRNCRSFLYVDNLVDAIVTALEDRSAIRACYLVSDGTDMSTPDLVRALAQATGEQVAIFPFPIFGLKVLAKLADAVGGIFGRSLPFDTYSISRLVESFRADGSAFAERFHWRPPIPPERALAMTCESASEKISR
jgi:nucleoside-diphosphate-sugar epimerase